MTYREVWFDRGGVRLHAVEAGPADGPLYILLHGFPEFWYGWRKQIPALADAGYRVIALDQRGYNLSDKPRDIASYGVAELAADVIAVAGDRTFRLAGHDWGAAVAWAVSLMRPDLVERLSILNVPHPVVMFRRLSRDPGQMLRSWYILFFQLPAAPEMAFRMVRRRAMLNTSRPGTFSNEDLDRYEQSWAQPGCITGMINWYRALLRVKPPYIPDPVVRVPTTVIWGRMDKFLKQEMAEESLKFCRQGHLIYLDNATHWVQHEEPAKVNEILCG